MKRHLVLATAAAAALLVGGAVTAVAVNGSGSGTSAPATAQGPGSGNGRQDIEDLREAHAAQVTAPQAAAAALTAVPGKVSGLDLDQDRPGLVWDADVLGNDGKWHKITLDAHTARVLNQRIDRGGDDDHARKHAALAGAQTDAAGAARKAAAGYGTVTSVDLDGDHRIKAVWEVETITEDGTEHKLLLDPHTGALSVAPARDAHDDRDGGDD
ncbi:PepSY domain-containing protein [Streptomyces sp. S186]|uniref:PepSY domain-containing protein n=1 Tax=Streptomyces sp. S186 TaxID=3434395 RepID=UPI003F661A0D